MNLTTSPIWAISTYYNPLQYKNRQRNYKIFKSNLSVPLITIELSITGQYELSKEDADILIQVKSKSILWHKEKLLNIALNYVPISAKYVAWVDCDIIFDNQSWHSEACVELEKNNLIQLFSKVFDLGPDIVSPPNDVKEMYTCYSTAYNWKNGSLMDTDANVPSSRRRSGNGLAWAAKKEIIQSVGFYDMMIIGSGDRALTNAALGKFDEAVDKTCMSERRRTHYLKWAQSFNKIVNGRIGYLEGSIFHLWHGNLTNRKYSDRHKEFAQFDFNPDVDLYVNEDGCWEWSHRNIEMENFVESYFISRKEDG